MIESICLRRLANMSQFFQNLLSYIGDHFSNDFYYLNKVIKKAEGDKD